MNSFQTTYRCDSNTARLVRPMLPRLCLFMLALAGSYCMAEERGLRFSITESGVMPMVLIRNGAAVDGILHDLAIRLAEKVDRRADLLVMPRMRVHRALLSGEIDVRCYVNPAWLDKPYSGYAWSVPFMLQRDLLVSHSTQAIAPQRLAKQAIGTVLGFHYPTLEALFDAEQLQRDDARTQGLVLRKLAAGRYDYAVTNELALLWFNRDRSEADKLHEVHELTQVEVACLVRDAPDVPTRALLEAMRQMREDGEFTAILQLYR